MPPPKKKPKQSASDFINRHFFKKPSQVISNDENQQDINEKDQQVKNVSTPTDELIEDDIDLVNNYNYNEDQPEINEKDQEIDENKLGINEKDQVEILDSPSVEKPSHAFPAISLNEPVSASSTFESVSLHQFQRIWI